MDIYELSSLSGCEASGHTAAQRRTELTEGNGEKCFDFQILNRHNFEEGSSRLSLNWNKSKSEEARMVSMMGI